MLVIAKNPLSNLNNHIDGSEKKIHWRCWFNVFCNVVGLASPITPILVKVILISVEIFPILVLFGLLHDVDCLSKSANEIGIVLGFVY